eukprot:comp16869_c0_seq1/m.27530 comp16869_c0_seq1/g.27530  ORF comp16869_c0_seq1/g.27530 comp16869_c0_seq1/m.27530 type:complete len:659 (+) comp16869_c0_seq1:3-1979(+)
MLGRAVLRRVFSSQASPYQALTEPFAPRIQESVCPSYHFQASLPSLPIPELQETLKEYINVISPISTPEEVEKTKKFTKLFESGEGKDLHDKLVMRDFKNRNTSYICDWWFDMYLRSRDPIPINVNPFMVFMDPTDAKLNTQINRATRMIYSSARFARALRDQTIIPEVFHMKPQNSNTEKFFGMASYYPRSLAYYWGYWNEAYALDMSQYASLFNTTRIPKKGCDELQSARQGNVIVLHKNRFFSIDALKKDGDPLPIAAIESQIRAILDSKTEALPLSDAVGLLTTENRDTWAEAREELVKLGNQEVFDAIDGALFVMCLDSESVDGHVNIGKHMLHSNGQNRWFDKSFSLIVTANAKCALNFEHSWGDGVAVVRFMQDMYADSVRPIPEVEPVKYPAPRELQFKLNDSVRQKITQASKRFLAQAESISLSVRQYTKWGRERLKQYKVSPDGIAQLSFQLGYRRMFGKTVSTYESASTAAYLHGRTECLRSATPESYAYVLRHLEKAPAGELNDLLDKVMKKHSWWTVAAATGKGIDRHLFALRKIAEEEIAAGKRKQLPDIFLDPIYARMGHNILSTSTLQVPILSGGGFGPVVADGFGIGYMVRDNDFGFVVSSYGGKQDTEVFVDSVEKSLNELDEVLSKRVAAPEKPKTAKA